MTHTRFQRKMGQMANAPAALMIAAFLLMASKQGLAADQTTAKNAADKAAPHLKQEVVDIELLTWPEIYKAIHDQGKTTVLLFNGGTEQRGPQGVTGAHNFIAQATADQIARKLGNALVAPVQ